MEVILVDWLLRSFFELVEFLVCVKSFTVLNKPLPPGNMGNKFFEIFKNQIYV